jgi:hypothetical protein
LPRKKLVNSVYILATLHENSNNQRAYDTMIVFSVSVIFKKTLTRSLLRIGLEKVNEHGNVSHHIIFKYCVVCCSVTVKPGFCISEVTI